MPSRRDKSAAVPFSASDVVKFAKTNPYIVRLLEDKALRANIQKTVMSSRSAFDRVSADRRSARSLLENGDLHSDVSDALTAFRDASIALMDAPKKKAKKGLRLGRKLLILVVAFILALVASEKLRTKVLDLLFGKEEEFEYTPPTPPAPAPPPAEPVSAA
jgi:hypothetical protein